MNKLLLLFIITVTISCSTQKTTETNVKNMDTVVTAEIPMVKDSIILIKDSSLATTIPIPTSNTIPGCVRQLIAGFEKDPVQNPPRKIFSYTYKSNTVYYVTAICCDMYSDLYDNNCKLLGHPDGGFSGRGDGNFAGFSKEATNEKLVWADPRKK